MKIDQVIDAVVQRLGRTSVGKELLEQETAATEAVNERRAARAELDAARSRESEIPPLVAARDAAQAACDAETSRLATELIAARRNLEHVVAQIDRDRSRAELTLRRSCDELVADSGAVMRWLLEVRGHVAQHGGIYAEQDRQIARDWSRRKVQPHDRAAYDELTARVAVADAAEKLLPAVDQAIEQMRGLQLEVDGDVASAVSAILAVLPERCACGKQRFDRPSVNPVPAFAGAA